MNQIKPADLSAIQHITQLLNRRFCLAKSDNVRVLIGKQIIQFLDLAIALNQGETQCRHINEAQY